MQPLDEVRPVVPLSDELLVLVDELRLPAADPAHVVLQLLDLVDLAFAAIAGGDL